LFGTSSNFNDFDEDDANIVTLLFLFGQRKVERERDRKGFNIKEECNIKENEERQASSQC